MQLAICLLTSIELLVTLTFCCIKQVLSLKNDQEVKYQITDQHLKSGLYTYEPLQQSEKLPQIK